MALLGHIATSSPTTFESFRKDYPDICASTHAAVAHTPAATSAAAPSAAAPATAVTPAAAASFAAASSAALAPARAREEQSGSSSSDEYVLSGTDHMAVDDFTEVSNKKRRKKRARQTPQVSKVPRKKSVDSPRSPDAPDSQEASPAAPAIIPHGDSGLTYDHQTKANATTAAPQPVAGENNLPPYMRNIKPPPLFIRDKDKWNRVSKLITDLRISAPNATNTSTGIKVQPSTSDDHRRLSRALREENIAYHTYALEDERLLRVVMKGVPKELPVELIKDDLLTKKYPVREVHRMYNGRTKAPYDMVLVVLDRTPEGKNIFKIKVCSNLAVAIEQPHKASHPGQCHRCQLYGHSSRFCQAKPRCVKCLGDHSTPNCKREKGCLEPPACVLCGATGHTANYGGCPRAPRRTRGQGTRPPAPSARPAPQSIYQPPPIGDLRPPRLNAWAKPLSSLRKAPSVAPASLPITPTPPARALSSPPLPIASLPSPPTINGPESDFALVCRFARAVNPIEIRQMAQAIRATNSDPAQRLEVSMRYSHVLEAIWQFSSQPQ